MWEGSHILEQAPRRSSSHVIEVKEAIESETLAGMNVLVSLEYVEISSAVEQVYDFQQG